MRRLATLTILTAAVLAATGGAPVPTTSAATSQMECTLFQGTPPRDALDTHEYPTCVTVQTSMSAAPAVGATKQVKVEVTASKGVSGVAPLSIELPKGLTASSLPKEFTSAAVSAAKSDGSVATRITGRITLAAGATVRLLFNVKATTAGDGQLRVVVADPTKSSIGGQSSVYLTYGAATDSKATHFGITLPSVLPLKTIPAGANSIGFKPALKTRPADSQSLVLGRQRSTRAHAAGTTCAKGSFNYQDQNGTWHPSPNLVVEAIDDNWNGDTTVASGLTNALGQYNLCFNNSETAFGEAATVDLYVRISASNSDWNIQDTAGDTYRWTTPVTNNVPAGNKDYGGLTTGNPNTMRSLHLFDEINNAWWAIPGCWDERNACEQKVLRWAPDQDVWPNMSGSDHIVRVPGPGPDSPVVVMHELGHQIMWDAFEHHWPATSCPSPHYINAAEDAGCAWTEGWPNWFAGHVLQNQQLGWWGFPAGTNNLSGSSPANTLLEDATWYTDNFTTAGDRVEAHVSGALWDLEDSANDQPWDRTSGGFDQLWATFQDHNSGTFQAFWTDLGSDGYATSSSNALSTLYSNTIDIGTLFRDPLGTGPVSRPDPPHYSPIASGSSNNHNWKATRTSRCYTITAQPKGTLRLGLGVYSDSAMTNLIASAPSGTGTKTLTFGSGTTAPTIVYPRVVWGSGTGGYDISTSSCLVLTKFPASVSIASALPSRAYALTPTGGRKVTVTVTPKPIGRVKATANPSLTILSSVSQGIGSQTVVTVDRAGAGKPETLTFTPPAGNQNEYVIRIDTLSGVGAYTLSVN